MSDFHVLRDQLDRLGLDRMTSLKAATTKAETAYQISGVVLAHPDGRRCIVEGGAVRWISGDEFWHVMHPERPEPRG